MNPWYLAIFLAALIGLAIGVAIGICQRRDRDAALLRNKAGSDGKPLTEELACQARNRFEEQCG